MIDYQEYLDEKVHSLRLICRTQWDYLDYSDANKWIEQNFVDLEGKYYATKILLHTIYYSKKDLVKLLNYGLHQLIYGKIIKDALIDQENIYILPSVTQSKVIRLKRDSYFIPLSDNNKPSESGNLVIGDLVHKLNIKDEQVGFHRDVTEELLKKYKTIIFVDDCIGSGKQLKKFWQSPDIKKIKEISPMYNIRIFYLVLIGYSKNLQKLKDDSDLDGIEVIICDQLTDNNRVFGENNIIWDKETNEIDKVIAYFEKIKRETGVQFLGFKNLDFAVILHDRLPNWSLPIFWKKSSGWEILLNRKTSI